MKIHCFYFLLVLIAIQAKAYNLESAAFQKHSLPGQAPGRSLDLIKESTLASLDELQPKSLLQELIGTWRLVSAEDLIEGQWRQSFGEAPKGYYSFDNQGHASVQFMKYPLDPPLTGDPLKGYLAYFGAYTVDEASSTFTVLVEGALNAKLVGSKQVRLFRFDNGKLVIGDLVTYRRTFVKYQ